MKKNILFLFVSVFIFSTVQAQNITITAPVTNNFISTTILPNGTADHTTLRAHYIIPASELQGIPTGTLIDEIGVNIQAAGTGTASGTIQLYLENTSDAVNAKSVNWASAISSMTSVYNGPFPVPSVVGPADLAITSPFTYTGGGIYVAYDYAGTVFGTAAPSYWVNTLLPNSTMTASSTSTTAPDSVNTSSNSRPETRFTFVNPFTNNLAVSQIRTEFGTSNAFFIDDNDVFVEVTNIGTQAVTNAVVSLELIGSTTYTSTQTIASIGSNASQIITFPNVPVSDVPGQIIEVTVPSDQQTFNDTLQYFQDISCDKFGFFNSGPATSSVGFNTGQGILGVRYDIPNGIAVNVTSIDFRVGNNTASPGNTIKGVLLNSSGVLVDSTLPFTITTADLGQDVSLPLLNGNVNYANQIVFAGIRQTANTSIGYFPVGLQDYISPGTDENFSSGVNGGAITYQNTLPPFMVAIGIEPRPLLVYSTSSSQVCAGSSVNIGVFPLNFDDYSLYENNVLLQNNTTANFIVNPTVTTTYEVVAKKGACLSPTGSITIFVVSEYIIPQVASFCTGETYSFNGQSLTAAGQYVDSLTSLGGCDSIITLDLTELMPTSSSFSETICSGDTYTFEGQDLDASGTYTEVIPNAVGCDSTITLNLTVNEVDVSVTVSEATITAANSGAGVTYQWIDCDNGNAPIAGETAVSYTADINNGLVGNYAVIITENGCTGQSACTTINFTSIENYLDAELVIFPNPVVDMLTVSTSIMDLKSYTIFDATGRQVASGAINQSENISINVSALASGTYVLQLGNNQHTIKKSFVK